MASSITLREHLDGPPESAPRLAVDAVGMGGRYYTRASFVDFGVDHEPGGVDDRLVPALHDVSIGIDKNQVRCLHGGEVFRVGVEPEVILQNRV